MYFICTYVKTYDPRLNEGERWIPFDLWPKQVELVRWILKRAETRTEGVIEKSRDTGVSWVVVSLLTWYLIFHSDITIGVGAALELQVEDSQNPTALFWKLRNLLDRLPQWMFNGKKYVSKSMTISNPNTGSVITGQCGDNIGRSGRSFIFFIDEFAQVERSHKVYNAVFGNTDALIVLSTPQGVGNMFEQMVSNIETRLDGRVFTMHWTDDPRKDEAWAAKKKAANAVTFAQEYDLDYTGSKDNIVIPGSWVQAAVGYQIEPKGAFVGGLDIGTGSQPSTVLTVRKGSVVKGQKTYDSGEGGVKAVPEILGRVINDIISATNSGGESIVSVAYDAAGDTGAASSKTLSNRKLPFSIIPILGQSDPSHMTWPDGKSSKQKFKNRRSEAYWLIRERFRKTYENKYEGGTHSHDECISIPNDPLLIRELSMPRYEETETGLTRVWSKKTMKEKGIASPDNADSLVYSFLAVVPPKRSPGRFSGYRHQ